MNTIEELASIPSTGSPLSYIEINNAVSSVLMSATGETKKDLYVKVLASKKGDVAGASVCSPALGLGIHWTYSYNKTLRFSLTLVCYGRKTNMIYVTNDAPTHRFKKGSAETQEEFQELLQLIAIDLSEGIIKEKYVNHRLKSSAFKMDHITSSLFFSGLVLRTDSLSPQQTSFLIAELKKLPVYSEMTMFEFFVMLTKAIDDSSPKNWLTENQNAATLCFSYAGENVKIETNELEKTTEIEESASDSESEIVDNFGKITEDDHNLDEETLDLDQTIDEDFEDSEDFDLPKDSDSEIEEAPFEEPTAEKKPKGLGLFGKFSKTIVSKNTGKEKTVVTLKPEQIENIIESREEKANIILMESDEVTESEIETMNQEIEEDEVVIEDEAAPWDESEEFETSETVDAEDFEEEIEGITESSKDDDADFDLSSEDVDDDFDFKTETVEEVEEEIVKDTTEEYPYLENYSDTEPSEILTSGSTKAFKFEDKNLTLVVQLKK